MRPLLHSRSGRSMAVEPPLDLRRLHAPRGRASNSSRMRRDGVVAVEVEAVVLGGRRGRRAGGSSRRGRRAARRSRPGSKNGASRSGTSLSCSTNGRIWRESSRRDLAGAAEVGHRLDEREDRQQRAHRQPVARLGAEVGQRVLPGLGARAASRSTPGERAPCPWSCTRAGDRPARRTRTGSRRTRAAGGRLAGWTPPARTFVHPVELRRREDDLGAGPAPRARRPPRCASGSSARKRGVEVERLHHDVDAVAQRLDDLVGAAAGVVVGGQVPGGRRGTRRSGRRSRRSCRPSRSAAPTGSASGCGCTRR